MKKFFAILFLSISIPEIFCAQTNSAIDLLEKGKALFELDDDDNAIDVLTEAIKLDPSLAEAYVFRARINNSKGNYDQGMADANRAIQLNPKLALAYYARGNTYRSTGDYNRAIEDYNEAIRLNPNDAGIRWRLENAVQKRGQ